MMMNIDRKPIIVYFSVSLYCFFQLSDRNQRNKTIGASHP